MTERNDFIALATLAGANVSELCRRFGVSRRTGHQWLRRYRKGGVAALADRSRRPHAHPWTAPPAAVVAVLARREAPPTWGPRERFGKPFSGLRPA